MKCKYYSNSPFKKWNKNKIIDIICKNEFIFEDEYGGIFSFYHKNRKNIFHLNYTLYLRKTMLFICNPNITVSPSIKSHKQLDIFLRNINKNIDAN